MKVTVVKEFRFEAAHRLPFHEGACQIHKFLLPNGEDFAIIK